MGDLKRIFTLLEVLHVPAGKSDPDLVHAGLLALFNSDLSLNGGSNVSHVYEVSFEQLKKMKKRKNEYT